ncbi:MAG TPA: hypothetical protein VFZ36_07215 [Vicinamibacterales bacterium]
MKLIAAVAAIATVAAMASPGSQPQRKSFLVTVIAPASGPVTDLTAGDFIVREGGETRDVVSAVRPAFPLAVSLLVDTTQPPPGMDTAPRDLRAALASFVDSLRASSPGARIALVEVSGGAVTTAPFDAKPEELTAAIARLFPAHPADAVFLEAIRAAAASLSPMPTPRRAIVTVDFNSSESLNEATMKRMTDALQQSGATVWAVSVRLPRAGGSRREPALNLITKNSGGLRLVANASSGLEAQLKQVADSLASQYLVDFRRPDASPMKPLQMETTRGLKVHVSPMSR